MAESFTTRDGIELVRVEPGTFVMGSGRGHGNARPPHKVTITRTFWIGKTEVTQAQYEAVTGRNPSAIVGPDDPVECVSWHEASRFAQLVADREGRSGFRLPTEAEWEYAARAGELGDRPGDQSPRTLGEHAWYKANSKGRHRPVAKKLPNAWGIHDTLGNVWEWVADIYGADYYRKSPPEDPKGPERGSSRLFRGGAWPWEDRSATFVRRGNYSFTHYAGKCPAAPAPEDQVDSMWDTDLGFRLAFSEKGVQQIMKSISGSR
jgi:formylglycine-generating enzyme required for sulfatase activity